MSSAVSWQTLDRDSIVLIVVLMSSRQINVQPRALVTSLIIALLVASPLTTFANLALFSASDIQRTGNLVPIRKSAIELVNETLTVRIAAETAAVTVTYDFANTGGADAVTVGFPVDLMPPAGQGTSYNLDHWQKDGLQELQIIDGTKQLSIDRVREETLPPQDRPKQLKEVAIKRRWSIATLQFKARERKAVSVTYIVRCIGVDKGFEHDPRWTFSPRTFLYTFRTATGWGTGRIRKLDIAVDMTYLRQNRFRVLEGEPKLKESGEGILRSEFQSVELGRLADLVIRYDSTPVLSQIYAERLRLSRSNWRLGICGPGKFGSDALVDGNPETSWTPESGNGVGTCFEFQPAQGSYIQSIAILNGKQTSATDYAAHARIKRVKVEYVFYLEEGRKRESFEQVFPDSSFDDRALRFPAALADFLDLPTGIEGIIENIRMTVLEVYPGNGNAPLAISDLYVYGVTPKK
jgi:hypothetical protein